MREKISAFFNSTWFFRLTALVLALFLFAYVNSSKSGFLRQTTRSGQTSTLMANKTVVVKMPLDLKVNSQKYVVSGYPQYVRVRITGPSALVTTTTNTQNFSVYANLSKLGTGEHTVKLKISGLNGELSSRVNPSTIKVKIQPRTTKTMPVTIRLSSKTVSGNYKVGTATSSLSNVQLTGAKSEVKRVTKVVAYVSMPKSATSDLRRQVTLQALDKNGRTVNVVVMPSTVTITVPISATKSSSDSDSSSSDSTSDSDSTSSSSETSSKSSSKETSSSSESSKKQSSASSTSSSSASSSTSISSTAEESSSSYS